MKKVFYGIVIAVPVILLLIFLALMVERNKKVTLPAPTGEFGIGRTTYEWTDTTRIDTLALEPGTHRELLLWVWYPAAKTQTDSTGEYLPEAWQEAISTRTGMFSGIFHKNLSKVRSHSTKNAPLVPSKNPYPVVFIKSGIGALTTDYTTIAEDLASHGYVVIGSDSPYSTNIVVFSDGRVINDNVKGNPSHIVSPVDRNRRLDRLATIWTNDLKYILTRLEQLAANDSADQLFRHIDLKQVGVFGHSLGGATAFRFCNTDKRCKAGISINGNPFGSVNENRLNKPFMFLMADQARNDSTAMQINTNIDTIYSQLPESSRAWINLKGARHYNFSDQALLREHFVARKAGDTGPIGKRRGLEVTTACVRTFFDANLKGASSASVKQLPAKYPEVVMRD